MASVRQSMKTGFMQFAYMPPDKMKPLDLITWQAKELMAMGGNVLCGGFSLPEEDAGKEEIRELFTKNNLEFELYASGWQDFKTDKEKAKEAVLASIRRSKYFDNIILRSAYNGGLRYELSRFNRERPVKEQMQFVISCLKDAAGIFEAEGVYLAIENHCDFTGRELAEILSAVNSKHVGCALDTGNSYTVYTDPNDDMDVLAEFTFTTHIKDMAVVRYESSLDLIPFQARGCAVGDGNVDVKRAVDLLSKKSPFARGLRLIIEHGWMEIPQGEDPGEYGRACLKKGMKYLNNLIGRGQ
ncbi:MAG: sugar phosphate isomerase/epimerase [Treponema sp.]|nr:sugar phosphate isomerase/epimerase [Treponema sp.]